MNKLKGEKLKSDLKSKKVYYYYDTEKSIKQISSEIFKNEDKIIHYPRAFDGGQRYKHIKRITYKGFNGKLPIGIIKSVTKGYGFTRTTNPIAFYVDSKYSISEIIIEKSGKTSLDNKKKILFLTEEDLSFLQNSFSVAFQKNRAEIDSLVQDTLHKLFPKIVSKPSKKYISNSIATALTSWGNSIDEFTLNDKQTIKDLFDKLSINKVDFLTPGSLAKTKEIVDNRYIQETLKKFKSLMSNISNTKALEKKWQKFLKENSWILSSIFAQPVILHKDEAYVGGKTIDNKNGKFNDFLIKNSLSDNVSFIEIKTHLTQLQDKLYRGEDVYSSSRELNASIVQVLNQRDNFQKEYYNFQGKNKSVTNFETFNSKCIVIVGAIKRMSKDQQYSFELFRSNSRDVEIITFDELQTKIESLQKLLSPAKV